MRGSITICCPFCGCIISDSCFMILFHFFGARSISFCIVWGVMWKNNEKSIQTLFQQALITINEQTNMVLFLSWTILFYILWGCLGHAQQKNRAVALVANHLVFHANEQLPSNSSSTPIYTNTAPIYMWPFSVWLAAAHQDRYRRYYITHASQIQPKVSKLISDSSSSKLRMGYMVGYGSHRKGSQ